MKSYCAPRRQVSSASQFSSNIWLLGTNTFGSDVIGTDIPSTLKASVVSFSLKQLPHPSLHPPRGPQLPIMLILWLISKNDSTVQLLDSNWCLNFCGFRQLVFIINMVLLLSSLQGRTVWTS